MAEDGQNEEVSETRTLEEEYEQAKKEKPNLGKLADSLAYQNFPALNLITDPLIRENVRLILINERLTFLKLCKQDITLNPSQKPVLKEYLSRSLKGVTDMKKVKVGEKLDWESHPEVLLTAATYINSL